MHVFNVLWSSMARLLSRRISDMRNAGGSVKDQYTIRSYSSHTRCMKRRKLPGFSNTGSRAIQGTGAVQQTPSPSVPQLNPAAASFQPSQPTTDESNDAGLYEVL